MSEIIKEITILDVFLVQKYSFALSVALVQPVYPTPLELQPKVHSHYEVFLY